MMDLVDKLIILQVLMLITFMAWLLMLSRHISFLEKQAIKKGYARYHPITGKWEWIETKQSIIAEAEHFRDNGPDIEKENGD